MTRKLLAIFSALLIAASLCACNSEKEKESDTSGKINIGGETTDKAGSETEDESGQGIGTGSQNNTDNAESYTYTEKNDIVYIIHPNGAVKLHGDGETSDTSLINGSKINRIAISTDGSWSKVVYENKTYYVVTKCLTTMSNLDEGFTDVSKTLHLDVDALSIRITPSMDNHTIGYFGKGDEVKIIAENTETGWYKVEFVNYDGDTVTGYVADDDKYYTEKSTAAESEAESTESTAASVADKGEETTAAAGK